MPSCSFSLCQTDLKFLQNASKSKSDPHTARIHLATTTSGFDCDSAYMIATTPETGLMNRSTTQWKKSNLSHLDGQVNQQEACCHPSHDPLVAFTSKLNTSGNLFSWIFHDLPKS